MKSGPDTGEENEDTEQQDRGSTRKRPHLEPSSGSADLEQSHGSNDVEMTQESGNTELLMYTSSIPAIADRYNICRSLIFFFLFLS